MRRFIHPRRFYGVGFQEGLSGLGVAKTPSIRNLQVLILEFTSEGISLGQKLMFLALSIVQTNQQLA